jgi:hypothetical protein
MKYHHILGLAAAVITSSVVTFAVVNYRMTPDNFRESLMPQLEQRLEPNQNRVAITPDDYVNMHVQVTLDCKVDHVKEKYEFARQKSRDVISGLYHWINQ